MVALADLWLPILLAAVLVFLVSFVLHMVLPLHKGDFRKLPGEEGLLDAMRGQGVQPGQYAFPCPSSMKDLGSPEMLERYKQGPVGSAIVIPSGPPAMGKSLVQWFVLSLVIGLLVAYTGTIGLKAGAEYMDVFRLTGTAAILGYAFSHVSDSIWKGLSWGVSVKFLFGGVVYALVTAGTFAWLWPDAA